MVRMRMQRLAGRKADALIVPAARLRRQRTQTMTMTSKATLLGHAPRLLIAAATIAALAGPSAAGEPLRVMTFNVRYATAPDGDNAWPLRKDLALEVIRTFDPDVLGVQEALRVQMDDFAAELPGYASLGVGREADGGGEYSAI